MPPDAPTMQTECNRAQLPGATRRARGRNLRAAQTAARPRTRDARGARAQRNTQRHPPNKRNARDRSKQGKVPRSKRGPR
eukprot:10498662-Lingulodinium_polyedra.AAC.1